MISLSVLIPWALVALLASAACSGSGAYTVDITDPCNKDFIRRMAVEMCGRGKRSSETELPADFSSKLSISLRIPEDKEKNSSVPSSLDMVLSLLTSEELKAVIGEQELERFERAEKALMHCCVHQCSPKDFEGAC